MAANVDYKAKYLSIRAKLVEASDVSFRLGYEEGMKEGQQQAQQQAQEEQMMQEQQMAEQQAAMGGGEEGMPMEEGMAEEGGGTEMDMQGEEGSELDDHIAELEGMVAKGEKPKVSDLRNMVLNITNLRKSHKASFQKKTEKVISKQKSVVDGILKKWEGENKDVTSNLEEVIKEHGIKLED